MILIFMTAKVKLTAKLMYVFTQPNPYEQDGIQDQFVRGVMLI